ncbi:hypothetical protein ACJMK2_006748 [Sinanodonta woodiana]|uniref:WDR11 first beta-propeller domain-containing protein n=1 Tax=Sinanodonta woodiana TaxID=1069815 RepID=A0ABD3VU51_SINWO
MKRSKKLSVQPKIIPSNLHSDNNGACDWGYHGYIAYGCKTHVVVVDHSTVEVIQTLDSHKDNVVKVKWQQQNFYHSQTAGRTYNLIVASADKKGSVIIWDVVSGKMRSEFTGGQRIQEMEWYPGTEESHELLVTLQGGNTLSIWETYTGVRLWKKEFSKNLSSFCLDPFDVHQLAILSEDSQVLLVPDLNSKRPPSNDFHIIRFTSNDSNPKQDDDTKNSGKDSSDGMNASTVARIVKRASWNKLTSLADNIQNLFGADTGTNKRQVQPEENRECIQVVFNPSRIHQLFIVYSSQILLLDIDMKILLNDIRLDPLSSALVKRVDSNNAVMRIYRVDSNNIVLRIYRVGSNNAVMKIYRVGSNTNVMKMYRVGSNNIVMRIYRVGSNNAVMRIYRVDSNNIVLRIYRVGSNTIVMRIYRVGSNNAVMKIYRVDSKNVVMRIYRVGSNTNVMKIYRVGSNNIVMRIYRVESNNALMRIYRVDSNNAVMRTYRVGSNNIVMRI